MEFKEILTIAGQPGLFRYLAQSVNGIIVESLDDGRRMNVTGASKISSLTEIAIYTDAQEIPLNKIFEKLFEKSGGAQSISHKSSSDQLKALMGEIVPDYDRDRVHVSDMKKIVAWYNILVKSGMTDFSVEEPAQDAAEEQPESTDTKE